MYDWNRNGKHDMQDAWISYKIYESMSKGNSNSNNSSSSGNGCLVAIGVGLLIFGIALLFA